MPILEIITSQLLIASVALILFYRGRYLDMVKEARDNSDGWKEAIELAKELYEHNKELVQMLEKKRWKEMESLSDDRTADNATHTSW